MQKLTAAMTATHLTSEDVLALQRRCVAIMATLAPHAWTRMPTGSAQKPHVSNRCVPVHVLQRVLLECIMARQWHVDLSLLSGKEFASVLEGTFNFDVVLRNTGDEGAVRQDACVAVAHTCVLLSPVQTGARWVRRAHA